jgi:hypothetical protein
MSNEIENKINVVMRRLSLNGTMGYIKEGPIKLLQVNESLLYLHSSQNHILSLNFEERIHTDIVLSGHIHIDEYDFTIEKMVSRSSDPEKFLELLLSSENPTIVEKTYQYNVVINGEKMGEIPEKDYITNHQMAIERWRMMAKNIANEHKRKTVMAITSPNGSRSVFFIKPRKA